MKTFIPKNLKKVLKTSDKSGLPPGELIHIGNKKTDEIEIQLITYNNNNYNIFEISSFEKLKNCIAQDNSCNWININGLHDTILIKNIGDYFNIHPLSLEDILNTEQRVKVEFYSSYVYCVFKIISFDKTIDIEQISLILTGNTVITFQEKPGDIFNPLRDRIFQSKGRIRSCGSDYLFYSILDSLTDSYFPHIENISNDLIDLEENLYKLPDNIELDIFHTIRTKVLNIKKAVFPLKDLNKSSDFQNSNLITHNTKIFFQDLSDHIHQILENLENQKEQILSLSEFRNSYYNNKMTKVMNVLSLIASIFIPLTFIAGIYGMNFENMPELKYPNAYFITLSIMAALAFFMILYFKKKKWL